jgi:hypothetical protein
MPKGKCKFLDEKDFCKLKGICGFQETEHFCDDYEEEEQ